MFWLVSKDSIIVRTTFRIVILHSLLFVEFLKTLKGILLFHQLDIVQRIT